MQQVGSRWLPPFDGGGTAGAHAVQQIGSRWLPPFDGGGTAGAHAVHKLFNAAASTGTTEACH